MAQLSTSARPGNALAALRQLCSQGLPMETAFEALQPILNRLAPIQGVVAGRVDEGGNPSASLATGNMAQVDWRRYFGEYFNHREEEAFTPFRRMLYSGDLMDRYHTLGPAFYRTDVFNEIFAAVHMRSGVRIILGAGGRRLGKVSLVRTEAKGFSLREERLLAAAAPYLEHLWSAPAASPACVSEAAEAEAWLLCDRQGRIHFLSDRALELLHMAAGVPQVNPYLADAGYDWARPLLRRLAAVLEASESGSASQPPVWEVRNRHGRFALRAWRMAAVTGGSGCLGVRIERHLPLSVQLLGAPAALGLSPRERDVLLAQAAGLSREETARQLGVGLASVVTYTRGLYNRLDVHNRDQLVAAVLASARAGAGGDGMTA